MRVRSQGGLISGPSINIFNTDGNGVKTNSLVLKGAKQGFRRQMADEVAPNYRKRVAAGEVFFNPMTSKSVYVSSHSNGYVQVQRVPAPGKAPKVTEVQGNWLDVYVPLDATQEYIFTTLIEHDAILSLQHEVTTKVLADRGMGPGNLWESIAEADQVLSLLNGFNKDIRKLIHRHLGKYGPIGLVLIPASAWLAFRYGLKPLYNDLQQVLNGLTNAKGPKRATTRAELTLSDTSYTPYKAQGSGSIANNYHCERSDTVVVRAMSLDEYNATALSEIGLTFKGLVTVPWELLWGSFIADWFVNLGDNIKALVPAVGFQNLGSCLTIKRTIQDVWICDGSVDGTDWVVRQPISGSFIAREESKNRMSLPNTKLLIKSDFRFDKATRVADALALTAVLLDNAWNASTGNKPRRKSPRAE